MNKQFRGSVILLLAAIIWGLAFTAQDMAAERVSVFTVGATRSLMATVFLALVIPLFDKLEGNGRFLFSKRRDPLRRREILGGIACGTALAVASALQQAGIVLSGPSKASFITTMYVVLVPVVGALLLHRRTPLRLWLAVAIALCGVGLITLGADLIPSLGDVLLFLCALCFCVQILLVDHFLPGSCGIRLSMMQFATAAVLNAILALLFEEISLAAIGSAILPLLFLGVMSSGCAFTLQIIGQRYCPPAPAAILMSTESLFGILGAALIVGEVLSLREYIGCAVVFLAVLLSQLPMKKK